MRADLLTETCYNIRIEPALHPLSGEQMSTATAATGDSAHSDIVASGFNFWVADFNTHVLMYGYLIPTCVQI